MIQQSHTWRYSQTNHNMKRHTLHHVHSSTSHRRHDTEATSVSIDDERRGCGACARRPMGVEWSVCATAYGRGVERAHAGLRAWSVRATDYDSATKKEWYTPPAVTWMS